MKKIYTLFLSLCFISTAANAQVIFSDDFENYTLGPVGSQNLPVWSVWSGNVSNTAESIIASDAFAASGSQSGLIGAGQGPQDAMLILGNLEMGTFQLSFNMYIPSGKTGYFNIQGRTSASGGAGNGGAGVFNSANIVFNNQTTGSGMPGLGGTYTNIGDAEPLVDWNYPEDEWFPIVILFDPENNVWTMTIDEVELAPMDFQSDRVIGAIDFFALDANNEYYIDDLVYEEVIISSVSNPILTGAKVYPNPVSDLLRIETSESVDEITIYNLLGSPLLQMNPDNGSSVVDMGSFSEGLYFVELRIGNETSTIKVTK